jgi:hypothetical protein
MDGIGFHTRERQVVGLYWPEQDTTTNVWSGGDGGFIFGLAPQGPAIDIQTRREAGIEAIRDACNDALVRTDD